MTQQEKQTISSSLSALSALMSQNRLAYKAGVSSATMNHMINHKWDLIKDEMWRKVMNALRIDLNWKHADTTNFKMLTTLLTSAQDKQLSVAVSYKEGHCKSHSYKMYEKSVENVIYVECKNYWTKKTYVQALLKAAGLNSDGTVGELIESFVDHVRSLHMPIIVIDQADKLKDPQLDLFMDFYNDLEGHCAFLLSGVPALEKRILRGVRRDKIGYREMYSRVGRKFIKLNETSLEDVKSVCVANGLEDEDAIIAIYNLSEGDMRRIRREIQKYFLTKKRAA